MTTDISHLLSLAVQATGPMTSYPSQGDWSDKIKATAVELFLLTDAEGEIGRRINRLGGAATFTGDIVSVARDSHTPRGLITLNTWNAATRTLDKLEEIRTDELNTPEGAATFAKAEALIGRHVKVYREEGTKAATAEQRTRLNSATIKTRTAIEVLDLGPAKANPAAATDPSAASRPEQSRPGRQQRPAQQESRPAARNAPQQSLAALPADTQDAVTTDVARKALWSALKPHQESGAITAEYRTAVYSALLSTVVKTDPQTGLITNLPELIEAGRDVQYADSEWGRQVLQAYQPADQTG